MYIPSTTCLHILLAHPCLYYNLLSPQYTVLYILFYCTFYSLFFLIIIIIIFFPIFIYIYSYVVLHILHCPLSGPDLTYISLLIISCIIEYVTNKKKLEPWYLSFSQTVVGRLRCFPAPWLVSESFQSLIRSPLQPAGAHGPLHTAKGGSPPTIKQNKTWIQQLTL